MKLWSEAAEISTPGSADAPTTGVTTSMSWKRAASTEHCRRRRTSGPPVRRAKSNGELDWWRLGLGSHGGCGAGGCLASPWATPCRRVEMIPCWTSEFTHFVRVIRLRKGFCCMAGTHSYVLGCPCPATSFACWVDVSPCNFALTLLSFPLLSSFCPVECFKHTAVQHDNEVKVWLRFAGYFFFSFRFSGEGQDVHLMS